jgi:hypothetical protein
MSFDRDDQLAPAAPVHHDGATDDYVESAPQADRRKAWEKLEAFAKSGRGKASDVLALIQAADYNTGVLSILPDLAKRTTGDIALAAARAVDATAFTALDLAFNTAKSDPSAKAVRDYLRTLSDAQIATFDARVIAPLQKMFPGPVLELLPQLLNIPPAIHSRPDMLTWLIKTTDVTVLGYMFVRQGEHPDLVKTLDTLPDGWTWLDKFHLTPSWIAGFGIEKMAATSTDPVAKPKLTALAATFTRDNDRRQAEATTARGDLDATLERGTDAEVIETAARTQAVDLSSGAPGDQAKIRKRLAGKSPGMILEFLLGAAQTLDFGLELFDGAKGAAGQQVRAFLASQEDAAVAKALAKDAVRARVRKHIGRKASVIELFEPRRLAEVHAEIAKERALRMWIYEEATPETLLWLAAGGGAGVSESLRIVKAEKGNGWVKKLRPGADEASLRRFVLNSKDTAAVQHVREHLLHEQPEATVDPDESKPEAADRAIYGHGARTRLTLATNSVGEDPVVAVTRLADLSADERAALVKDASALKMLLDDLEGPHLVRAMYLLRPTITQLLAMPFPANKKVRELLPYLATRPDVEDFTAAKSEVALRQARSLFDPVSPLDVFPALTKPALLAKALPNNEALFEWILEETEPSTAMLLFAQDPVKHIAAQMMSERQNLTDNLPDHDRLLPEGQRGYDIVHEKITDKDSKRESQDYIDGEMDGDRSANSAALHLQRSADKATLPQQIAELSSRNGDAKSMLALVRRAPREQKNLLLDGEHPEVFTLRRITKMNPHQVFPEYNVAELFSSRAMRDWLFEDEAPTVILAMLEGQKIAIHRAAQYIQLRTYWLDQCPRGGALMPAERAVFDAMHVHFTDPDALRKLFETRFDVTVEAFDVDETKKLWAIVARLPPGQFDQKAVNKVVEKDIAALGQWAKPDIEIDNESERFAGKFDTSYDEGQKLTLDQVKRIYGLTDDQVATASADGGWLTEDQGKYTVNPIEDNPQFDSTVLHEIGHSIDTMLGDKTELVFGLAGWKAYGLGDFEQWANDMNGLDGIDTASKPRVVEAWKQAIHTNRPVKDMVDVDHPALASSSSSPLVKEAQKGKLFSYTDADKEVYADRVCIRNGLQLFSLTQQAYLSAPSQYSLYAPAEYFAECYVEYYRGYDGTPATEKAKGGRLPPWIKDWFTINVDKIRLNPARVR